MPFRCSHFLSFWTLKQLFEKMYGAVENKFGLFLTNPLRKSVCCTLGILSLGLFAGKSRLLAPSNCQRSRFGSPMPYATATGGLFVCLRAVVLAKLKRVLLSPFWSTPSKWRGRNFPPPRTAKHLQSGVDEV